MSSEVASESTNNKKEPPHIVTKQSSSPVDRDDTSRSAKQQARTPKHANTTDNDPRGGRQQQRVNYAPGAPATGYPPRDYRYDQQRGQPPPQHYSPRQQPQQHPGQFYHNRSTRGGEMATISPDRYYNARGEDRYNGGGQGGPYDNRGGPPPYPMDQRAYMEQQQQGGPPPQQFSNYPPTYRPQYRGQPYPPAAAGYPPQAQQYGGPPRGQGYPPPREYAPPEGPPRYPDQTTGAGTNNANSNFTRAVSSSFDRSVKSRGNEQDGKQPPSNKLMEAVPAPPPAGADGTNSVAAQSDDSSWRQLNQVASIDEAELQKRIASKKTTEAGRNISVNERPNSTSSSLTNSPSNEHALEAAAALKATKTTALDSLSSVASGQEPMDTDAAKKGPPSPTSSAGSLDLMKCHSGSSGLLHGFNASATTVQSSLDLVSKRSREERSDINTNPTNKDTELRRAPSAMSTDAQQKEAQQQPPAKKARKSGSKKDPLGIDCSPPLSPSGGERKRASGGGGRSRNFNASPNLYFDKAPSYTYSIDSNPSFPRGGGGYPSGTTNRPASSSSSTITPMDRGGGGGGGGPDVGGPQDGVGPSLPSWDIQPQDSFGNGSVGGGGPLMSNFSFSQDYPMLQSSGSNLGYDGRRQMESRNQSFDGGHGYHGAFPRSDSMDQGYGGPPRQQGGPYHPQDYNMKGSFAPPMAAGWGGGNGYGRGPPPPPHYGAPPPVYGGGGNRNGPPHSPHHAHYPMERNYSQDSAVRTSPPPPRMAFQPPPEFAAPHNPHLSRRPPPAVYIMSSSANRESEVISKNRPGIYSWTKEDDARLTEVMKKYKNPRDWTPIAKEHGRGKSAKECHERWIRYLKPGVRKGQWQDHEDAIVVEAVTTSTEQPFTRWSDLAQQLPGRVGKQIRDRWVNHLNPNINHLPFSREDDLLLWDGHKKLGKRWVEISTKYFNSSRSENHIKNRWYSASFKKFIANEFGPDAYSGGKDGKKNKKAKAGDSATVEASV